MKNPVLGSLIRTFLATLGVYFLRHHSSSLIALLSFLLLFSIIYLQPPFNNRKFLVSGLALMVIPVFVPPGGQGLEWLLLILWASAFFLLIGVKNLILLRRQGSYETVHLLIVFGFGVLYLLSSLPFVPQIILFLVFFLLFREFYFVLAPPYPQRLALVAAALAFLLGEIAWLLSLLPINFLAGATLLALTTYLFHDFMLHHFQGALNRQIVLRNVTLFVALSIILMLLPA